VPGRSAKRRACLLIILLLAPAGCRSAREGGGEEADTRSRPASGPAFLANPCSVTATFPPVDLAAEVNTFAQSIPSEGGYVDPGTDRDTRDRIVQAFEVLVRDRRPGEACTKLLGSGYHLQLASDSATGQQLIIFREDLVDGAYRRAWGLYVVAWNTAFFDFGPVPSGLVVEAPHACPDSAGGQACRSGDTASHLAAVKVFREGRARYLFVNGADRRAGGTFSAADCEANSACSDVAHQPDSLFEKIHEAAVLADHGGLGVDARVVQLHRFNKACHDGDPATPCSSGDDGPLIDNVASGGSGNGAGGAANVAVSNGSGATSSLAADVAAAVERADASFFHVCLFKTGTRCSELGATRNVQGRHMGGGRFVHVEANQDVLGDARRRDELASALGSALKSCLVGVACPE
jgi:hypothetical protein